MDDFVCHGEPTHPKDHPPKQKQFPQNVFAQTPLPLFCLFLSDSQITHLICVRPRHLLYDFLGVFRPFKKEEQQEGGPKHPRIVNVLGGHTLDE